MKGAVTKTRFFPATSLRRCNSIYTDNTHHVVRMREACHILSANSDQQYMSAIQSWRLTFSDK